MSLSHALPFGLRDVKLIPITGLNTLGTPVDLPVARTFSFSESEDFETLEGDDTTVASVGAGPTAGWELESGGLPFGAFQVMAGGTITDSGTTPDTKRTFSKKTTDRRPYFQTEGQAISDSGGDVHGVLYRCKADGDLEGEWANGSFFLLSASGTAFGDTVGDTPTDLLYDFVQNETATAIV